MDGRCGVYNIRLLVIGYLISRNAKRGRFAKKTEIIFAPASPPHTGYWVSAAALFSRDMSDKRNASLVAAALLYLTSRHWLLLRLIFSSMELANWGIYWCRYSSEGRFHGRTGYSITWGSLPGISFSLEDAPYGADI